MKVVCSTGISMSLYFILTGCTVGRYLEITYENGSPVFLVTHKNLFGRLVPDRSACVTYIRVENYQDREHVWEVQRLDAGCLPYRIRYGSNLPHTRTLLPAHPLVSGKSYDVILAILGGGAQDSFEAQ
jgi:hypothetical protein